jgi:aminomethyltransferase
MTLTPEMKQKEHFRKALYQTPFHERSSALNKLNVWHRWKDYTVADAYFNTALEYSAIRNACAVFDLTPMTKHLITGPDAFAFLDRLVTRDVSKIKPQRVGYAVWCDDNGKVIDDGTIFHLKPGVYRLCSQERQLEWLERSAFGFDVQMVEDTHEVACLAFQGPTSCAVLKAIGCTGVENLKPFDIGYFQFSGPSGGGEVMVSRTGFTGDLGYELWVDNSRAIPLWDALFDKGAIHGIRPMGTNALEISRIEAGFIQAQVDFMPADQAIHPDRARSPFELDLGRLVDFKKPNFNGRRALLEEQKVGSRYRFVKLDVAGNKIAKAAYIYNREKNGEIVGTVTTAAWSPSAKTNIAFASLHMPWGRPGDTLWADIYYQRELQWSRVMAPCRVVEGAFWDPPRRRATPAADF